MNTFDIIGLDPLELNRKPATIQTIINTLWSDDYHEQQPMTGAPEVCLCELCQSLVPALEQVARKNGRLRERLTTLEAALDEIMRSDYQTAVNIAYNALAEGGE